MKKIKIITSFEGKQEAVQISDLEFKTNKFISDVENKNGQITNISYCINNNEGIIVAIIIEYEVDGENEDVNLEKSRSNKMLETIRQKGTVKVDEEK